MGKDRVQLAVNEIMERIIDGRFAENSFLPSEAELAPVLSVSRLTLREAIKVLRERGVLVVVQGRGTHVAPREEWTDLGALIEMTIRTRSSREVGLKLVELRRMIEVGAAGLAARNRSEIQAAELERSVEAMAEAGARGDVERVVHEDLVFHQTIMRASGNPFMLAVMTPLDTALRNIRLITSSDKGVRSRALTHHRAICKAIRSFNEEDAKEAMRAHMSQTRKDTLLATADPATFTPML